MQGGWSFDAMEDICFDDALLPFLAGRPDATFCARTPLHPRCELLDAAHSAWDAWEAAALADDGTLQAPFAELCTPVVTLRAGETAAAVAAGTARGAALQVTGSSGGGSRLCCR